MPRTYKCSFCGKEYPPATGLMYIRNDGRIYYFCTVRCRKGSLVYGRDSRKLKWTAYHGKKERGR